MSRAELELFKELRGQFFVWFGIIGGALSLANHWSNIITLANWMHWLVDHFMNIVHSFWILFGAIFNISISREAASLLSMAIFYFSLTIGSIILSNRKTSISRTKLLLSPLVYFVWLVVFTFVTSALISIYKVYINPSSGIPFHWIMFFVVIGLPSFLSYKVISDGSRGENAILAILNLILILSTRFFAHNFSKLLPGFADGALLIKFIYFALFTYLVCCLPVAFAPARGLIKRISFMLIGIGIIFTLSELSKLITNMPPS